MDLRHRAWEQDYLERAFCDLGYTSRIICVLYDTESVIDYSEHDSKEDIPRFITDFSKPHFCEILENLHNCLMKCIKPFLIPNVYSAVLDFEYLGELFNHQLKEILFVLILVIFRHLFSRTPGFFFHKFFFCCRWWRFQTTWGQFWFMAQKPVPV